MFLVSIERPKLCIVVTVLKRIPKEKKMSEEKDRVPLGFGMALASRPDALLAFMSMPAQKKKEWVEKAERKQTKAHMNQVVEELIASTPEIH